MANHHFLLWRGHSVAEGTLAYSEVEFVSKGHFVILRTLNLQVLSSFLPANFEIFILDNIV